MLSKVLSRVLHFNPVALEEPVDVNLAFDPRLMTFLLALVLTLVRALLAAHVAHNSPDAPRGVQAGK